MEDRVPHIITENWIIPPRWFSMFMPEDRTRGVDQDGPFCIMRTKLSDAIARTQVAHQTVLGAFGEGSVEAEIEHLLEWLEMFHQQSLVELDYGGLAGYLDHGMKLAGEESGIEADTSVEDVLLSLSGLAAGDGQMAGQGYERLVTRWRVVQGFESAI